MYNLQDKKRNAYTSKFYKKARKEAEADAQSPKTCRKRASDAYAEAAARFDKAAKEGTPLDD